MSTSDLNSGTNINPFLKYQNIAMNTIVEKADTPQHLNQTHKGNSVPESCADGQTDWQTCVDETANEVKQIKRSSSCSQSFRQNSQHEETILTVCESLKIEKGFSDSKMVNNGVSEGSEHVNHINYEIYI